MGKSLLEEDWLDYCKEMMQKAEKKGGKLLLLNYSEEQLDQMIARKGLTRYTEHTITTKAALLAELDKVRRQGYALDDEENEVGSRCMACPIRDYSGDIVAGISITGPNTG